MTGAQKRSTFLFTIEAGLVSCACDLPYSWKVLALGLMLYSSSLEILDHFWARGYAFSSCTRLANYTVCPEQRANIWHVYMKDILHDLACSLLLYVMSTRRTYLWVSLRVDELGHPGSANSQLTSARVSMSSPNQEIYTPSGIPALAVCGQSNLTSETQELNK